MTSPCSKTRSKPTLTVTVARVRVLSVPTSDRFEEGIKYAYYYGEAGAESPIIRFDNHHGTHELHLGEEPVEIDYPGLAEIFRAWRAALPPEKRDDW
nr:DUF6516 family protein [Halorubrum sp. CSM-61]